LSFNVSNSPETSSEEEEGTNQSSLFR
jgi:hypothetical protein